MLSPTHRFVEQPRLGVRYLADYMASSKRGERRILQNSKYRPIARVIQHAEAQSTVSKFIRDGGKDVGWLQEEASRLRDKMADDDFDRALFDHNADYIARFASVAGGLNMPKAQILEAGQIGKININGVTVTVGLHMRLRKLTRTNKIKEGGAMLRYAKGKAVSLEAAAFQSAFIHGYLRETAIGQSVESDPLLCLTIDAYAALCHAAPTNSVTRYANMKAACASIAEQWPNIQPPSNAILDG